MPKDAFYARQIVFNVKKVKKNQVVRYIRRDSFIIQLYSKSKKVKNCLVHPYNDP